MGRPNKSKSLNVDAWRKAPISMFGATVAGIGHIPGGPGTYAAAVASPFLVWGSSAPLVWRLVCFGLLVLISIPLCTRADKAMGEHDSRKIVLDEVVGVGATLIWFSDLGWIEALVGLVAFRVFDILKPPPAGYIDREYTGGWAVVADDLVAGIWAVPFVVIAIYFLS